MHSKSRVNDRYPIYSIYYDMILFHFGLQSSLNNSLPNQFQFLNLNVYSRFMLESISKTRKQEWVIKREELTLSVR